MTTKMQVKPVMARDMIVSFLKAKLVPMMGGSPGIGKSSIVHDVAADFGLKVIDLRLAQCDPTDLLGFPTVKGGKSGYLPMETFPIEGDPLPEGYNGWLIFLDELNSASPAVQAASYKLILDRQVGIYRLHEKVLIVCAGNLETDGAIVQPMSTALQSRLVHLELTVDPEQWNAWAVEHSLDHRITSYVNWKPDMLYDFRADHTDKTYASPRTWEFASRLIKDQDVGSAIMLNMLAGVIGQGAAREFITFCKIYRDLPTIAQIMSHPDTLKVPDEPSILYAISGSLAHNMKDTNVGQLMKFVSRMPVEFQVVCLREAIRRNKTIMAHEAVQKWIAKSATELF